MYSLNVSQLSSEHGAVGGMVDLMMSHDHPISNGEMSLDADDIARQLEKENQDYLEQSRYLSEKLSALQSEMEDLRLEEKGDIKRRSTDVPQGEQLHATVVRQCSHKQTAYDKVCSTDHMTDHMIPSMMSQFFFL